MNIVKTIILTLIFAALVVIGYFLKDSPELFRELKVEKKKSENQSNLQREAYFRQISGKDLETTFSQWMSLITDLENTLHVFQTKKGERQYSDMVHKCLMYGSEETVDILACLSQHQYVMVNRKESDDDLKNYKSLMYMCSLIASLKFDFTGIKIDPFQIIETKMTDLRENDNEKILRKANVQVQNEIMRYRKQKE